MRFLSTFLLVFALISGVFATGIEDGTIPGGGDPFLKEFSIFPNPSSGLVTVSLETFEGDQPLTLKIYSIIGQEMQSQRIEPFSGASSLKLDLSKLAKGVYMIEISNNKQSRSKRLLLK